MLLSSKSYAYGSAVFYYWGAPGDIPLLGNLFQSQSHHTQKTNLLLFLTPRVLSSPEDLQEMTDQKQQEMDAAREANH